MSSENLKSEMEEEISQAILVIPQADKLESIEIGVNLFPACSTLKAPGLLML